MTEEQYEIYLEGVLCGLEAFAWMKDGVYYVGTTGTTLKAAQEKAKAGLLYGQRAKPSGE